MVIRGVVNARLEPLVRLTIQSPSGEKEIEVVLDTGFDGSLSLPPELIERLGLAWQRRAYARLADGSDIVVDVYEATVLWGEVARRVAVDAASTDPLVGMRMLRQHEVYIEAVVGGTVAVRPLPARSENET